MCVLHDIIPDTTQQNNPFHEKLLALFDSILFICVPLDHYCINHKKMESSNESMALQTTQNTKNDLEI